MTNSEVTSGETSARPRRSFARLGPSSGNFRVRLLDTRLGDLAGLFTFVVALAVRFAVDDVLPPGFPFLTFFPAVVVTTFFCGLRPGVTSAVLCGFAAWYFFIPPKNSFSIGPQAAVAMVFYVFVVAVDIALIRAAFRAGVRLENERKVTARLYERQRAMFQELQHRVANNMQFVGSLLALQRRTVERDPALGVAAIVEAEERLATFSRLHRRLYDPSLVDAPVGDTLRALCAELLSASSSGGVALYVEAVPVHLQLDRLSTLSLLVVEIVTNALKHAFPEGRGSIDLRLQISKPGRLLLVVADDGRGMPAGFDAAAGGSLGFRIVQSLVAQLDATLSVESHRGTCVRVEFPAA